MPVKARTGARITEELKEQIKRAVLDRRMFEEDWVIEAIQEKLQRAGVSVVVGPYADLSSDDRVILDQFAKFLRRTKNARIKEAAMRSVRTFDELTNL